MIHNRQEKLSDHVGRLLRHSERAKFAVGHFFLGGFDAMNDELKGIKELRLLIGNASTRETMEQISEGYRRLELVGQAVNQVRHHRRSR